MFNITASNLTALEVNVLMNALEDYKNHHLNAHANDTCSHADLFTAAARIADKINVERSEP